VDGPHSTPRGEPEEILGEPHSTPRGHSKRAYADVCWIVPNCLDLETKGLRQHAGRKGKSL
jgi:hypothetical protein